MNQGALLLDVRSQAEFDGGHIIDARHVPQEQDLPRPARRLKRFKDKVVITCCESGMRSAPRPACCRPGLHQGRQPARRAAGLAHREPAAGQGRPGKPKQ